MIEGLPWIAWAPACACVLLGLVLAIAALAALRAALEAIRRLSSMDESLKALLARSKAQAEKQEAPTINVNVGTPLPGQPAVDKGQVPAPEAPAPGTKTPGAKPKREGGDEASTESADSGDEAETLSPRPVRQAQSTQAASGNAFAVKCPSCGAENSRYRSECFNCGKQL